MKLSICILPIDSHMHPKMNLMRIGTQPLILQGESAHPLPGSCPHTRMHMTARLSVRGQVPRIYVEELQMTEVLFAPVPALLMP